MGSDDRQDRFVDVDDSPVKGFAVVDEEGKSIGRLEEVLLGENNQPEYFGINTGLFGRKSTLVPVDLTLINIDQELLMVRVPADKVKDAPEYDDDEAVTPDLEGAVLAHYGLVGKASAGIYPSRVVEPSAGGATGPDVQVEKDEVRVLRAEEEVQAGTRSTVAGTVRIRKRVVTEPQQITVTRRREVVEVERVPVGQEASGTEGSEAAPRTSPVQGHIVEGDVEIPVMEEEIVVLKQPVVREEVRVRKSVVEEEQPVDVTVRKEQVEVEDDTPTPS